MESLPWVEKYRPSKFEDLIGNTEIIRTISLLIESENFPHFLFYGQAGTGKTSLILTCAKKLYGEAFSSMVLEMNASDNRGIEVVRNQIKSFASTKTLFNNRVKLIILDEADQMTSTAQYALRKMIEKYTSNVRFCLICNTITNIIPALQSRCTKFRFLPITNEQIKGRLQTIIINEKIRISNNALDTLIMTCKGDMRTCLNLLQSLSYTIISEQLIYHNTASLSPFDIEQLILSTSHSFSEIYQYLIKLNKPIDNVIKSLTEQITLNNQEYLSILPKLADLEYHYSSNHVSSYIGFGVLTSLLLSR